MVRAAPAVLYARIQNRDERRQGHQSPSRAPNHVQTQAHEFPDCTPTPVDVPIFCDTPSLTRNELYQLRHPQSYMLDFKTEMSAADFTNLHPKLPITSKPKHTSSPTTLLPVDVPIFSNSPSLTCNELYQLRRPQSYMLEFKNGASCTCNPIC